MAKVTLTDVEVTAGELDRTTNPLRDSDGRPRVEETDGDRARPSLLGADSTRLGPYQIVCELASGGMATVYLALYRSIQGFQKLCAVKRIHPHLASERAFANMFADEAQIAARISHPFVCDVFSFGRTEQSHYIAMEFLRGEPLSTLSRRVSRSPTLGSDPRFPALAARLVANFAEGLHAAHTLRDERGLLLDIVHRDVTPHNLFVLYDGSVRVTDFGIARARGRLHQTEGQQLKGKLSYIAPEQLRDGHVDARVDVWGLGVTLWELLAGRRLFLGKNEVETLASVTAQVISPPSQLRATIPAELDRIVLRALDRNIGTRYQSARELSRDLERFMTSVADPVPAMDVADWMALVFPEGPTRIQALIEQAATVGDATADDAFDWVPSQRGAQIPTNGSYVVVSAPPPRASSAPPTRDFGAERRAALMQLELPHEPTGKPRLILLEQVSQRSHQLRGVSSPRSRVVVAACAMAFVLFSAAVAMKLLGFGEAAGVAK